jgi:N,N'-diacetyllegionaminate synthase
MKTITIDGKEIGEEKPVYIIAEAGVNHNGNIELAKKMVDAAKDAGVDAIKFQTFKSENVVTKNAGLCSYQEKNVGKQESMLEMIKKLELKYNEFIDLKKYCDEKKMLFLSAPHSDDAIDFLDPLMPAYKVPSPDITNYPYLKKIAEKNKPIIIGTGMSTIEEIKNALKIIKDAGNNQIILLHCTSDYPCPLEDVNLKAMNTIKEECKTLVGYSDHTLGLDTPKIATKIGAVLIEKHFTLDKSLPGPDHVASLDPNELKEMVYAIRNKEYNVDSEKEKIILGSSEKKPVKKEIEISSVVRKSIIAKQEIMPGTIITEEMLIIKRPGTGIPSKRLDEIVGKKAKQHIQEEEMINFEQLELDN